MRSLSGRAWWQSLRAHTTGFILGAVILGTMVALVAQEPQAFLRGINVLQGNIVTSAGYVFSGSTLSRDYRTNTTNDGGATTYTAAQILTGLITRRPLTAGNVTDVLPTATTLAAAIPGVATGHSFSFVMDMGASPGGSVTLNGASTNVTYSGGCSTALTTDGTMQVYIVFTSATAYRAVCVQGGI